MIDTSELLLWILSTIASRFFQFLLNSLGESHQLVSTLQSKLDSINQVNDSLQFELDESKMAAADSQQEVARKITNLLAMKKEMETIKEEHSAEVTYFFKMYRGMAARAYVS